jgi:hypothetical protein
MLDTSNELQVRTHKERHPMRSVINGFSGWARMSHSDNESLRAVDAAITVVGTLLVALAWAMVKH